MSSPSGVFLFDIDGTLLRAGTAVHRESFAHAYRTVYGLPLSLEGVRAGGRTDSWLLAEPLRRYGMDDARIWQGRPQAFAEMQDFVEARLGDLRERVLPGVEAVLEGLRERGFLLGLLTGNLSRIAWAKLRHAGLAGYFQVGGFGEESEVRSHLVPVALAEAARMVGRPIPPCEAVLVGDTPLDVEAGRAHGTRTAAVATGPVSLEELEACGADVVLPSLEDAQSAVRELAGLVENGP